MKPKVWQLAEFKDVKPLNQSVILFPNGMNMLGYRESYI